MIAQLAIAGSLLAKRRVNETVGTLRTDNVIFVVVLVIVVYIFAALTFFPALRARTDCGAFIIMVVIGVRRITMKMKNQEKKTKFITKDILKTSIIGAFQKLNPKYMMKNPVMFVVEVGFVISMIMTICPTIFGDDSELRNYNGIVTVILFVTILFANFAESVAEGRGKAQAESLKKTKKDTMATLLLKDGTEKVVNASELKKGDIIIVRTNEVIANDGEVIEGVASVDESAITGESAPVTREAGGDFSSVTGGTTVVSDWLKIRITSEPGQSFLDKMISLLVEGASRQKNRKKLR